MADFTLPELGENVTAGDVLRVLVKPGDTVAKDQTVLELETDKATIEVPSSVAGRVTAVSVKAGDKVKVGQLVLTVEDGAGTPAAAPAASPEEAPEKAEGEASETAPEKAPEKAPAKRPEKASSPPASKGAEDADTAVAANTSNKIPEGGLEQHTEGPKRPAAPGAAGGKVKAGDKEPAEQSADRPSTAAAGAGKVVDISRGARPSAGPAPSETPPAPAAPSVRRMARELGVDIDDVSGSGTDGRISVEDVKTHAKRLLEGAARAGADAAPGGAGVGIALPDFSRWGEIERQPMRPVRRKTAEHLSAAWRTIPHVTQHDLADITALEELRKRYAKEIEEAGGNLTVTAIATKVVAAALKVFPQFNASIDLAAEEIIHKKYVNIGIAVDTDRGLLVPVVRDADTKNIIQIAVEIAELSAKARDRKITLQEMQGGCFSISNLGGIGGTYFTPIVNAPELAILGISRARMEPVYQGSEFVPRLMLPLSLSYDHRAIDGADGIRFLRWVVQAFEQPFLLALQG
jgi:pyruvate dehydrogenase E2 component (dihydrolipoamide acetyltransferase)